MDEGEEDMAPDIKTTWSQNIMSSVKDGSGGRKVRCSFRSSWRREFVRQVVVQTARVKLLTWHQSQATLLHSCVRASVHVLDSHHRCPTDWMWLDKSLALVMNVNDHLKSSLSRQRRPGWINRNTDKGDNDFAGWTDPDTHEDQGNERHVSQIHVEQPGRRAPPRSLIDFFLQHPPVTREISCDRQLSRGPTGSYCWLSESIASC